MMAEGRNLSHKLYTVQLPSVRKWRKARVLLVSCRNVPVNVLKYVYSKVGMYMSVLCFS